MPTDLNETLGGQDNEISPDLVGHWSAKFKLVRIREPCDHHERDVFLSTAAAASILSMWIAAYVPSTWMQSRPGHEPQRGQVRDNGLVGSSSGILGTGKNDTIAD